MDTTRRQSDACKVHDPSWVKSTGAKLVDKVGAVYGRLELNLYIIRRLHVEQQFAKSYMDFPFPLPLVHHNSPVLEPLIYWIDLDLLYLEMSKTEFGTFSMSFPLSFSPNLNGILFSHILCLLHT